MSPFADAESDFEGLDETVSIPISALEHYSYCPRQCALIHVEQTFEENLFTIRGEIAHERVDTSADVATRGVRVIRSMTLWSDRLALQGKSDVVEMRDTGPYPVEYKLGRPAGEHAALQLCAQAICLEEMLGAAVPRGAIFYIGLRRRVEVEIDSELRAVTLKAIEAVRTVLQSQRLPPAPNDARCPNCSLINACLPNVVGEPARLRGLQGVLFRPMALPAGDNDA